MMDEVEWTQQTDEESDSRLCGTLRFLLSHLLTQRPINSVLLRIAYPTFDHQRHHVLTSE